jgi:putative ABC transport system ATP-binding protein
MSLLIRTKGLSREYLMGDTTLRVLDGIDLSIEHGEYVALMGPSGSGKSTLMHIMGCLDTPSAGEYWLDGQQVSGMDGDALAEVRSTKIGFVFQTFNLLSRETALENVLLPLFYSPRRPADPLAQARKALDAVDLGHRLSHRPNSLSGGERQRVAIARALINDPRLVLADEPTGNLDSKRGQQILDLFDALHREGRSLVMVTHDPEIAARAGRIVVLRDGRIVEERRGTRSRSGRTRSRHATL